jgi:hypothetical protein
LNKIKSSNLPQHQIHRIRPVKSGESRLSRQPLADEIIELFLRSPWAIRRFDVALGASLVLRAKQLLYILRADAVTAWAAWMAI